MQAVIKALKEREAALLTLQAIEDERERKQKASVGLQEDGQKTLGGDKRKSAKAASLENDVAALDAAAQAAHGEYERITQRNEEVCVCVCVRACGRGRRCSRSHALMQNQHQGNVASQPSVQWSSPSLSSVSDVAGQRHAARLHRAENPPGLFSAVQRHVCGACGLRGDDATCRSSSDGRRHEMLSLLLCW